jgi:hypothetical protein
MNTHRISKNVEFDDYWLAFLNSHKDSTNRACHYVGTSLVIFGVISGVFFIPVLHAFLICCVGLSLTLCGHFVYENNRPHLLKNLSKPVWNLVCDFMMLYLFVFENARLKQQLDRLDQ